jgi:predicted enzyme related to lactoylglutathione lyase
MHWFRKDGILSNDPRLLKRLDMIMQIKSTNILLYCKKWEEMVAFYETTLRLPITASNEWFVEFKLTKISRLSVADESRTSIKSAGGKGITIGLQVRDVEMTRTKLKDAGLNPTVVKEVWGAKTFYVFDPEGNRIEFWSGPARA